MDMINQFPIDYMHAVNLGVTRRLVMAWKSGPKTIRLSENIFKVMDEKLLSLKKSVPSEFSRTTREISDIRLWKDTEFRTLLMYTGPVVFQGVLPKKWYENFLYLSVGVSLLMSETLLAEHAAFANKLLRYFVRSAQDLYGKRFDTYNVHCLVHLTDVAVQYGSLENCLAFPFENNMQRLK